MELDPRRLLAGLVDGHPLDVYLNDHLAGATFGADLAGQLAERLGGAPMRELAEEIREDRRTLMALMDRLGTPRNPIKQTMTWVAEQISHIKLSGLSAGDRDYGTFMALETLSLGVEGKAEMWRALADVAERYPEMSQTELQQLQERAMRQRQVIETERFTAARRALAARGS